MNSEDSMLDEVSQQQKDNYYVILLIWAHFMQIDGEKVETVRDYILGGSKISADGDCSMKLRHLLLRRKAMTNLDSIFREGNGTPLQ